MGETIELTASDGPTLAAYLEASAGAPGGGVVVIQEISGVSQHLRVGADSYDEASARLALERTLTFFEQQYMG